MSVNRQDVIVSGIESELFGTLRLANDMLVLLFEAHRTTDSQS